MEDFRRELREHEQQNLNEFALLHRVIFGDPEIGEKGMKEKVDEIHMLLTQARGVTSFFSGLRGGLLFLLAVAGVIAWIKGFK